jgi:hypothetical protein
MESINYLYMRPISFTDVFDDIVHFDVLDETLNYFLFGVNLFFEAHFLSGVDFFSLTH